MQNYVSIICIILIIPQIVLGSAGDRSPYYQKCVEKCSLLNCTEDGLTYIDDNNQSFYLKILQWSCEDECRYGCMWGTVEAFQKRNWRTPQFHGKWPFIRLFGLQEPASVIFSVFNLCIHYESLKAFRKQIHRYTPHYWLWHSFSFVSMHAWMWSIFFHAKDTPVTEYFDYMSAFSVILYSFFCMGIRLLYFKSIFYKIIFGATVLALFLNHTTYLSQTKFDYSYNMAINVFIGFLTSLFWFGWCLYNRKQQPYVWKCAAFVSLMGVSTLLEILDYPPFFWIFDAHSLWHLSTVPLTFLFYSFIIDDSKYLRKQYYQVTPKKDKLN